VITQRFRRTFAALGVRNFRLYFSGQLISVIGTWMQRVAQSWLVLELTGSGTAVGGVTALQFLPIFVMAPAGGLLADRMDKRRLLYVTQTLAGAIAATLGILVLTDSVELWMVYGLAFALGMVGSFDNPTRRAFVIEMVGRSSLTNAVGLTSVLVNTGRIIGPALGGVLIVTVGIGLCFVLNAVSYLAVIGALVLMRSGELDRPDRLPRRRGQLREGLRYVASTPLLRVITVILVVTSIFAYEYEVILPLMARFTFGGDANTFGVMFAATGAGAVVGGLHAANTTRLVPRTLVVRAVAFALALGATAAAPVFWVALVTLAFVGATGTSMLTLSNSMMQLAARPEMQGRVVALRAVAFLGMRPIGGPVVGWLGEHLGPRVAMGIAGGAVLAVGLWAWSRLGSEDVGLADEEADPRPGQAEAPE
jgi:MFS family permease